MTRGENFDSAIPICPVVRVMSYTFGECRRLGRPWHRKSTGIPKRKKTQFSRREIRTFREWELRIQPQGLATTSVPRKARITLDPRDCARSQRFVRRGNTSGPDDRNSDSREILSALRISTAAERAGLRFGSQLLCIGQGRTRRGSPRDHYECVVLVLKQYCLGKNYSLSMPARIMPYSRNQLI